MSTDPFGGVAPGLIGVLGGRARSKHYTISGTTIVPNFQSYIETAGFLSLSISNKTNIDLYVAPDSSPIPGTPSTYIVTAGNVARLPFQGVRLYYQFAPQVNPNVPTPGTLVVDIFTSITEVDYLDQPIAGQAGGIPFSQQVNNAAISIVITGKPGQVIRIIALIVTYTNTANGQTLTITDSGAPSWSPWQIVCPGTTTPVIPPLGAGLASTPGGTLTIALPANAAITTVAGLYLQG